MGATCNITPLAVDCQIQFAGSRKCNKMQEDLPSFY